LQPRLEARAATRPRPSGAPAPAAGEDPDYLSKQLITYIGNKRALLGPIGRAVDRVRRRLGKDRLRVFDAFAGSGVVSRFMKSRASYLAANDLEEYAAVVGRCFLRNRRDVDREALGEIVFELNRRVETDRFEPGFIEEMYAPADETRIRPTDRVFYTPENARRLDRYRRLIEQAPGEFRDLLLGPLLSRASVHANTAGVFKGFYKDRRTKIGRFGGSNADALRRIRGRILLETPVLSRFTCDVEVFQDDANAVARRLRGLDLAYLDPPYNQHPYGSNYFMLNLLVRYERPSRVSRVSGIPVDWKRSGYNVRARSAALLEDLVAAIDAPFLLVSFNDDGFIEPERMRATLARFGRVDAAATKYNVFRASRNLHGRELHVTEQLFLVERR
jgi:adenine-specific DNA-methyltransferase